MIRPFSVMYLERIRSMTLMSLSKIIGLVNKKVILQPLTSNKREWVEEMRQKTGDTY